MMKTSKEMKKYLSIMLVVLVMTALFPLPCRAAGRIDTDRDVILHILYQNGEQPLPDAVFSAYAVGDVDESGAITVTDTFSGYPIDLEDIDQAGWQALAVTLKGYVQRDGVEACATQSTDEDGKADMTLKPGLYLVFASPVTFENGDIYFSDPFMAFLPALDAEKNVWVYEADAKPKNTNYTTARKVLKIWEDEGYETVRPEEVTVDLLCDGEIFATVGLSEENDWRYDWGELDPTHEWLVAERVPEGYYAMTGRNGNAFTITNRFVVPVSADEIAVQKKISGDKPAKDAKFTFVLTANEEGNPMPEGAEQGIAKVSIQGAGSVSFGKFDFPRAGVYSYTVQEEAGKARGWTYDNTVYTVTFTVTEKEGVLSVEKDIRAGDTAKDVIEFDNPYKTPSGKLPQTGLLWWPVPVLLVAGLILVMLGCMRHRIDKYGR